MNFPLVLTSFTGPVLLRFLGLFILFLSAGPAGGEAQASDRPGASPLPLPAAAAPDPVSLSLAVEQIPDPRIQALIDQVTPTLVYSYMAGLTGEQAVVIAGLPTTLRDRNTWNPEYGNEGIQHAVQYVYEHFQALGLSTSPHIWDDETNPNMIAEQPGSTHPDSIYYVTAHLDNLPYISDGVSAAPGADDNASGSAAVLIAAQILSQLDCRYTLRYALFTGEEQGLLGSRAYVSSVLGQKIEGALNLDMIGWDSNGDAALDLYARMGYPDDNRMAAAFTRAIYAYDLPLIPEILGNRLDASDHASFWNYGIPAMLALEDMNDFNDYYHTQDDRLAYLNLPYMTAFIQALIGAVAHLACLPPAPVYLPLVVR